MADENQIKLIKEGVEVWNKWRDHREAKIEMSGVNLSRANLIGADLLVANLSGAKLVGADLKGANLWGANLSEADLTNANLSGANLRRANLVGANLNEADLSGANLSLATLSKAKLIEADLKEANLSEGNLTDANLREADLTNADLREAELKGADFWHTRFGGANLSKANLDGACLAGANLWEADLSGAQLHGADLSGAQLWETNLTGATLSKANLMWANLRGANLAGAYLNEANLMWANLYRANLSGASLQYANLVQSDLNQATLTGCKIFGISAWGIKGTPNDQLSLVITPDNEDKITVDNLQVAQFIYLLLDNKEVREVIDTITSKAVLILGRFTEERKAILDALHNELRQHDYLPILFDFEAPKSRDITETISTLAHMAKFVIADITDARSISQELMLIVPDLPSVPVQPILLNSQQEYGMFEHFKRYPWVLPTYYYKDIQEIISSLQDRILLPLELKVRELTSK